MVHDPLAGIVRVVVDATNLLHARARMRGWGGAGGGDGAPLPPTAFVAGLRAAIPAAIPIDLVFDGPPAGVSGRLASAMHVRYSGHRSADQVVVEIVAGAGDRAGGAHDVLVVTDDAALRDRVRAVGARTCGTAWLLARTGRSRTRGTTLGNRRPC
jgi:hypothetical protein